MDDHRTSGSTDGYGDDQGTRVGAPDQKSASAPQSASAPRQHTDAPSARPERETGVGSEASEGVHDAQQGTGRSEGDASGLSDQETGRSTRDGGKRAGSEPLTEDADQHRSGYGGAGGAPVTSSDQREEPRRR